MVFSMWLGLVTLAFFSVTPPAPTPTLILISTIFAICVTLCAFSFSVSWTVLLVPGPPFLTLQGQESKRVLSLYSCSCSKLGQKPHQCQGTLVSGSGSDTQNDVARLSPLCFSVPCLFLSLGILLFFSFHCTSWIRSFDWLNAQK